MLCSAGIGFSRWYLDNFHSYIKIKDFAVKNNYFNDGNWLPRLILFSAISAFIFTSTNSEANWIRNFIAESCDKEHPLHFNLVKNILSTFYAIKNKVKAGEITQEIGDKIWKEEVERFQDFLHELTKDYDKKISSINNNETRKIMKLEWDFFTAAVMHTAPEFYSRDSMPPDSRISRVFSQKCRSIVLGSN